LNELKIEHQHLKMTISVLGEKRVFLIEAENRTSVHNYKCMFDSK